MQGRIKQGRESTNRCVLRATQSYPESFRVTQSYQESRRAVQSHPELLRGTPEQSGNGPTKGPMDGRTDRWTYPLIEMQGRI